MQKLCRFKLDLDDHVIKKLKQKGFEDMQLLWFSPQIPCFLKPEVAVNNFSNEIHLFFDASQQDHGAAC